MNMRGHQARLFVISLFFCLILLVLLWRMYDLMVLDRPFLKGQGDARSLRYVDISAYRGMIVDRQGSPLAVSTPVQSLWVNPKVFSADNTQMAALAKLLQVPLKELTSHLAKAKHKEFLYLQRQMAPGLVKKISELSINGLNFQEEFKRYYPAGESTAQLLGFTDIDDTGLEGLELAYNDWLAGIPGKKRVLKDRLGRIIDELGIIKEPKPGHVLQLSIDHRIQYFAYHELQNTLEQFGAKSGSAIVIDSKSGEVLAVANAPSFNPNVRNRYTLDTYRNKAFIDTFEPGSVMKPLSLASALDTGKFTPKTVIDTRPGWMVVQGHSIRDIHNYGVLDVTGVLEYSSNVGVTKMVLASPPNQLIDLLSRCGFGQRTDSGYPGESSGSLVRVKAASPFVLATLGFGYGASITAIQLARSYLVFANGGKLLPISLIHNQKNGEVVQAVNEKTANQVLTMMEAVVNTDVGTGRSARVAGYRVAGKTGTARIAGKQGYEENRHIASFVGIAPVSDPRLIVAVVIYEPTHGGYYAAAVAGPLFSKIMGASLRILDVYPDGFTGTT
jgi:cell division protein FtsI (penicillin-binding protein 3)